MDAATPGVDDRGGTMTRLGRRVTVLLLTLVGCYAALVALVWVSQDFLTFPGAGRGAEVELIVPPGVTVEALDVPGVGAVRVALVRSPQAPAVVVAFGGNGEDLRSGLRWVQLFAQHRVAAIYVEHPGYGRSAGRPGEASFHATAAAAGAFARQLAAGRPVVAFGNSIGTFPATRLAALGFADRVLLRAPPHDLVAVGAARFPFLPVAWFMRHRFDARSDAARFTGPVMILHGDRDGIVPARFGRELAAAFAGPVDFVVAADFGHNDLPIGIDGPFAARVGTFLRGGRR